MEPAEESLPTPRGRRIVRIAGAESYVALAIMLLFATEMLVAPFPLIPRFGEPVDRAIGVTLWACGWLFSISGARHAEGEARGAALVSLAFFAILSAVVVLVSLAARWG